MKKVALGGAGVSLAAIASAHAQQGGAINDGDAAILSFLAAAELIEADLWQQYAELANANPPFMAALNNIDNDMSSYVTQNTADEFSHADFLNAFLMASGRDPVDLDAFRTLPSSDATGSLGLDRLTSLSNLNVDTSYYLRYRSSGNPDFGDTFGQVEKIVNRTGIPLHDGYTNNQIQAIANTAAFHFGMIEQGGSSLYDVMSLKASSLTTLRILTSIGGTEIVHFTIWNEKAAGIIPVDSGDGLVFTAPPEGNKVMPKPCKFLSLDFPFCSVIRPTSDNLNGPVAVVNFLVQTGLFFGQSKQFFSAVNKLAANAEAASRKD
jgi:hypothetical protein